MLKKNENQNKIVFCSEMEIMRLFLSRAVSV